MNGGKQFIFEQQQPTRCFLNKQSLFLGKREYQAIFFLRYRLKTLVRACDMIVIGK